MDKTRTRIPLALGFSPERANYPVGPANVQDFFILELLNQGRADAFFARRYGDARKNCTEQEKKRLAANIGIH